MTTVHADTELAYTGILTHAGEARHKTIDTDGHTVPVLVLHLSTDTAPMRPIYVEQAFPVGHEAQCAAAARRYHKGQRVTVQAPVHHHRLSVVATHIHTEQPTV